MAAGFAGLAVAATMLVGGRLGWVGPDASARVRAIEGELVRLADGDLAPVNAGETIERGGRVRTGNGAGAVLELADGSRVELAERSELTLARRSDGVVLDLERGALIVEAAEQKRGHLYVRTADCTVSVVGTIFSVNHGLRGSRVSVLDGEVEVRQGARLAVLRPGDQVATHAYLSQVPIAQEIAWSRNAEEYRERIEALAELGRELDETLATPGERTSTRLLDLAPAATGVWVAVPNVSGQLAEAWELVERRVAENPTLAAWWNERFSDGESTRRLAEMVADMRQFGAHLGDEVTIAVGLDGERHGEAPMLLAEVADGRGFDALLDAEIERLNAEAGQIALIRIDDPGTAVAPENGVLVWLTADGLLAVSPSPERLRELAAAIDAGGSGFVGTALHSRLAGVYADGAGWVAGIDAGSLVARARNDDSERHGFEALGLTAAEQFVFESETVDGVTESRATLGFRGERSGLASWLAAPAPAGALDFVSPEAAFAIAGLTKQPEAMFDDLLALVTAHEDGHALEELAEAEARLGFSLRDDLAASIGSDVAIALDGPWLPQPSWKLVVEIRDPSRFELALGRIVETINTETAANGHPGIRFAQEEADGRRYLTLAAAETDALVYLSFVDGYLVAAPSRALIVEAAARRDAGTSLVRSQEFLDRLPRDADPNFSALVWQHLDSVAGPLAELLSSGLPEEQRDEIAALAGSAGPVLIVAYGEAEQIRFVAQGTNGPLGFSFERLLALAGALGGGDTNDAVELREPSTGTAALPADETPIGAAA
jgi:hypothetical protein